ncbi:MAG: YfhO family protein [Prevotella sp.]|nr:YfhO family protein [Prevotella sp.]
MITKEQLKKVLPDVLVVVLFALLAFAYFYPADIEGRILYRHDASAGRGAGQEQTEYLQRTGERTRWTNALFGGMPTYQLAPSYESTDALESLGAFYHLWLPENVWYVFAYLLGFYILLRAFDFRQSLAALGSILWSFSSYFLIIIAAGHIWKVFALAYLPPMIAGVVLAYRGRYLSALLLTAIFSALEINANHVQMTYYYLFIILAMVIAYLVEALRKKTLPQFAKATAVCAVGALLGVMINLSNLYHTWQYSKESMRGKSELVKANSENQTSSGLDRDYITQWSYGIDETFTLLIPNAKGGAHQIRLGSDAKAMAKCDSQYAQYVGQWYQYWGDQPFTAGPVYVGAFVMMLFVLSLFIVKGPMKWALLAVTVLSILLSWGKYFMPLTNVFIDYVPMYAKFRTVSSILVIAEFTIPLLAMMGLKAIVDDPTLLGRKMRWVYVSFGLTGGLCLLFALMPTAFFDFNSVADRMQLSQYVSQEYLGPMLDNIAKVRAAVFTADCWRSFWVIVIGLVILLVYKFGKLKTPVMAGALLVLCLVDLWTVNKRYLNDSMFVDKTMREQPISKSAAEEQILQDQSLDFRVFNLASDTFNENETSFYFKSVGGYHPAKLRRYQEMIDAYIAPEKNTLFKAVVEAQGDITKVKGDSLFPVLNMLNTKYFIFPLQNNQTLPMQNPYAMGNAWMVDKVTYVATANEEIDGVGKVDLRHEAVADKRFEETLGASTAQDSTSAVTLLSYEPNRLKYEVNSEKGGVVVFSEIYYPGWTATVDGKEVELGRVNYILRALRVEGGNHQVELAFFPRSITTTETIAYCSYGVLILLLLLAIGMKWRSYHWSSSHR